MINARINVIRVKYRKTLAQFIARRVRLIQRHNESERGKSMA